MQQPHEHGCSHYNRYGRVRVHTDTRLRRTSYPRFRRSGRREMAPPITLTLTSLQLPAVCVSLFSPSPRFFCFPSLRGASAGGLPEYANVRPVNEKWRYYSASSICVPVVSKGRPLGPVVRSALRPGLLPTDGSLLLLLAADSREVAALVRGSFPARIQWLK